MKREHERMVRDHESDRVAIEADLRSWLRSETEKAVEAAEAVQKRMDALDGMYEDMQVRNG